MLVGLVLAALVILAAVSGDGGLPVALALGALSVTWLLINGQAEGPVLWTFDENHGLTATDLAGIAGLAIAVWRAVQHVRRRSRRNP